MMVPNLLLALCLSCPQLPGESFGPREGPDPPAWVIPSPEEGAPSLCIPPPQCRPNSLVKPRTTWTAPIERKNALSRLSIGGVLRLVALALLFFVILGIGLFCGLFLLCSPQSQNNAPRSG
jgi:hypothetical protein